MIEILTNRYCRLTLERDRLIELDMGCGKGGFLLALAQRYPERLVVGTDVMLGRLRKVASRVKRQHIENIRLWRANNRELVEYQLPDSCINRLHILCPDPWPKARHRDRRLLNSDFLNRLPRIMADGGLIHIASDDDVYLELVRKNLSTVKGLGLDSLDAIGDILDIETEFEKQWKAAGKTVEHLACRIIGSE